MDHRRAKPRLAPLRKQRAALAATALAALALTACGAIPPVAVTDPLQLDGKQVAVSFGAAQVAAVLGPAAVPGSGGGTFAFDDVPMQDLPLTPGRLTNDLGIARATLDAGEGGAPETITLSDLRLEVQAWQGAADFASAAPADRFAFVITSAGPVTLTRGQCDAASCQYSHAGNELAFGTVGLTGADVAAALRVGTRAPEPNQMSLGLTLSAAPDELAGRTLTLELDAAAGSVGL